MSRRKSVRELQAQLRFAQARAAYTPPERAEGTATRRRPKDAVMYQATSPLASEAQAFTVQAPAAGIQFFGGLAALGLAVAATDPTPPSGFRPARVLAVVGDANPTVVRSRASNRAYTRYARGTRGSNTQNSFSAPISAATPAGLDTRVRAVFTAVKPNLGGGFGRAWFEPERLPVATSG